MIRWHSYCFVIVLFACQASAQQKSALIDLELVAKKMLFPKDYLRFNDTTDLMRKRYGAGVLASQEVIGNQMNTFHPISFTAAAPKTLLTDEFIQKADAYLERHRSKPEAAKGLRRMELPDGSWGYIGIEGFGPNGALIGATCTDANRSRDVKIIIACGSDPLAMVEGGESYQKLFSGEIDATPALGELVTMLVAAARQIELSSTGQQHQDPKATPAEAQGPNKQQPTPQQKQLAVTDSYKRNLIGVLVLILVAVLIWLVLAKRKV